MKINSKQHITKKGVVKNNPKKKKIKVEELIKKLNQHKFVDDVLYEKENNRIIITQKYFKDYIKYFDVGRELENFVEKLTGKLIEPCSVNLNDWYLYLD